MAGTDEQRAWVERVLQFGFPASGAATGAAPRPPRGKLLPIWNTAKETVDAGIGKLQAALLAEGDEDLKAIADFGLFGATRGQTVRLIAALTDADRGPSPAADGKVAAAVEEFRGFLASAPIVGLLDDNPFGVSAGLRATFGPALDEIAEAVAA